MSLPKCEIELNRYDSIARKCLVELFLVEVLTLHLEKNTMRVRVLENLSGGPMLIGHSKTQNVNADNFFEKHEIREKGILNK